MSQVPKYSTRTRLQEYNRFTPIGHLIVSNSQSCLAAEGPCLWDCGQLRTANNQNLWPKAYHSISTGVLTRRCCSHIPGMTLKLRPDIPLACLMSLAENAPSFLVLPLCLVLLHGRTMVNG